MNAYADFLARKALTAPVCGLTDVPQLHPALFPFQRDIVSWALRRGRAAIFADCGMGKGQPPSTPVLTPHGWQPIGSLEIGDEIIASSGQAAIVRGVFPKPRQATYRVFFSDDSSIVVDADHLHICRTNNDRQRGNPWRVMSTIELLRSENLRYGHEGKSRNYDIPIVSDVQFRSDLTALPIDPYVLGVLLGDGHLDGNISISSADEELIQEVRKRLPVGTSLEYKDRYDWSIKTGLTGCVRHPFRQSLIALGLMGTRSFSKFVPRSYLYASPLDRLLLLQGLMDTDGYIANGGCSEFYSTSEQLADAVVHLVRSLGGIPTRTIKHTACNGKAGLPCHVVTFSLATHNPFMLSRKASKWNPTPRDNGRWIDSIEYECIQETVCIAVDSLDESYVTDHFVVTHNTLMQLEWARHIPGDVLVLAPLAVAQQTVREGERFGISVHYCRSDAERKPGLTITNYEMLEHFDPKAFSGVVLDESSIIKHQDSKTRSRVIEAFRETPYRLACTATPAPNDFMELGNHAEFLQTLTRAEMLATFFVHDGGETQKWRLKGHAEQDFWRWLASWSVMIRKPSDLGYEDGDFVLPPLRMHEHVIDIGRPTDGYLFAPEAVTLQDRIAARRESIDERAAVCAEMVNASSEAWVVWCALNAEADALARLIPDAVEVRGSDSLESKETKLAAFTEGRARVVISKSSIAGHGLNWQHCHNQAFVGLSDSWEDFYQSARRCYRFGQTKPVNLHLIIANTEGAVLKNIKDKEAAAAVMADNIVLHMRDQMRANIKGTTQMRTDYARETATGEGWRLELGDCVDVARELPSDSIHYMMTSCPFASLYTYSASDRDMGNCKGSEEFFEHFAFLVHELYRVAIPGRLMSVHCMNLPTSKANHGYIGIRDFRGDIIRLFESKGFIYHSEVCIWKDPVTAMQRTKALGLLYKQLKKDSAMSRQGIADYLVTFRKPGENPERVTKTEESFPVDVWQRYASPVWMDINPSDTLQFRSAREHADERHIAPLQLQVIERGIELWTNPGDTVLDPFAGIGSTGFVALQLGRKFVGSELKASYFRQAVANLQHVNRNKAGDLFHEAEATGT